MPQGKPYAGTIRKLVLGIDIGTTYSGVSYCILTPGEVPKVLSVTRFPGQEGENRLRDTKIPSILYYDGRGNVRAVGAEALVDDNTIMAEQEGWTLAEWFKLRLQPDGPQANGSSLARVLAHKSIINIYADYLTYLFRCAKVFISDQPIGRQVLESEANIDFVLSHPNGWGGDQQRQMRLAVIKAGLIPDTPDGHARVHFVTEGEASLHFCIANGLTEDVLEVDNHIMIVDAGGGTVDLSTYKVLRSSSVNVVESSAPDCLLHGSKFVNDRARVFLQETLEGSRFGKDDDINEMVKYFESNTKPTFRDPGKVSYIKFGGRDSTDVPHGIKKGVLSLPGVDIERLFEPSVTAIKGAIRAQARLATGRISRILLVGGFANSPYLRSRLQDFAESEGIPLFCPNSQTSKAAAEGSLWYHLDRSVSARIAKYTFGTSGCINFIPFLPDHMKRMEKAFVGIDGDVSLPNAFAPIVSRGTLVTEDQEFRVSMSHNSSSPDSRITLRIMSYKGAQERPRWVDEDTENFSTHCLVHAELGSKSYEQRVGMRGEYYTKEYKAVILFGLTEMKALISWESDGQEHRSPATLVFEGADA
ncbi:hypothetical protein DAEQUDRAFT_758451 [Daedalea quercina L-15889]|uniref:Actin-like ATPase domain-containing protein n=1 Tax=Daedalea quercina L-15889 TaxID=1314783 RepID=A0A165NFG8_9APHY|nr:hypothetical protein DAEQUDRAFT_758451 [Daedalea quercina L-15889]